MGLVTITKNEAKYAHQSYYEGEFEVVLMKRSGPGDFPPFSFVFGLSDWGSWEGLISTDGEKIVVTKSSYFDLSIPKEVFEFSLTDIIRINDGWWKLELVLNKTIDRLTVETMFLKILLIGTFFLSPFVLFRSTKKVRFRLKNEFDNLHQFKSLLGVKNAR